MTSRKNPGTQGCKDPGTQGCKDPGTQGCKDQGPRDVRTQGPRDVLLDFKGLTEVKISLGSATGLDALKEKVKQKKHIRTQMVVFMMVLESHGIPIHKQLPSKQFQVMSILVLFIGILRVELQWQRNY